MYQAIIPQSVAQKPNVANNHPINRGGTMAAHASCHDQPEKRLKMKSACGVEAAAVPRI
jgi:hypothetical protein